MTIKQAFPIPIYEKIIDLGLSQDEINFLYTYGLGSRPNSHKSDNSFVGYNDNDKILELERLSILNDRIYNCIHEFVELYGLNKDYWYIAKSWITVTEPGGSINMHNHTGHGGLISGVVYLDAPVNCGNIVLVNPYPFRDRFPFIRQTDENASYYKITPEVGKVLLWPASVNHGTERNESGKMRLSLAFDIFFINPINGLPPKDIIDKIYGKQS
jgi:uncharacterized protein (TIGR02466 family)